MPTNSTNDLPPEAPASVLDSGGNFKADQEKGTVRFTGLQHATKRIIRRNEWPAGVTPPDDDLVWDIENVWTLPSKGLKQEHLDVLTADGSFSIV